MEAHLDDVFTRLARIRALKAKMARSEQALAEAERERAQDVVALWERRIHAAADVAPEQGGDAAIRGLFALNGELARRGALGEVVRKDAVVAQRVERAQALERDQKVAEKLAEQRAEVRAGETRRREQRELDELASLGWWRRDA